MERPKIDPNLEEETKDAEESTKESLRQKWAQEFNTSLNPLPERGQDAEPGAGMF